MQNIIEVNQLKKSFGKHHVLNDLSFTIEKGSVVGILGSNGAGKTTLLQTLIGLHLADSGNIKLLGETVPDLSSQTKQKIGYVSQESELLSWMSVQQLIDYTQSFYPQWNSSLVDFLLNDWQLDRRSKVHKLSTGQQQKLAIIMAIAPEPDLLILDEPVASLDPTTRRKFIKTLLELNTNEQQTVLFSTHITSDLERVAAKVLLIKDGQCYFYGEIDDLKERIVKLHITSSQPLPHELAIPGTLNITLTQNQATVTVEDIREINLEELSKRLTANIRLELLSLDDIFVELHL
ncbi:ABC transporter ATP-binding protein [Pleionea litopenaei]|uniref:ABC transporter ATP-binding protein n=1 Tax=Pleionea litopenaei TaxID=3070815 RepID=A0AA51RR33_9GAMM|nr:ABC transporter ATP-binding protein [Pleionea sp. HL-JVS1]WMS86056.1 ABC transporter ATP-binding protein [Pleionea sp. HL-JVS1]